MKSIWNGSISFGLVNIPVKLYSAVDSQAFKFRLIHKKHKVPIHYKKTCDKCKGEVDWEDITKGYEVSKGEFITIDDKELQKIKPKSKDSIEIKEFVDSNQIDPIFFDKHYYVGPSKKGDKTYFLFKEILQQKAKAAIGKFVMREKEYVCAMDSYREGILLTTLNYAYEIRDISKIEELKERPDISKQELELGIELINKLSVKEFDISDFKDTYANKLKELIRKKEKGETIEVSEEPKAETKEKNLVEALKASLK